MTITLSWLDRLEYGAQIPGLVQDRAMLKMHNPKNGEFFHELEVDSAESIRQKAQAARGAQIQWARTPLETRIKVVKIFGEKLQAQKDELAEVLTREMGKPLKQALGEITANQARIDFFVENASNASEPRSVTDSADLKEKITYEPLGLVANISAWNYPYFVGTNVIVPAILMGNAVLYKPSEITALTGLKITKAMHEALDSVGFTSALFAPIIGAGDVGHQLLQQNLDGVFFTGSVGTGRKIAQATYQVPGGYFPKLQLELGGKDPVYVCEDVDVQAAAEGLMDGAMYNAGQSCCGVERIYVADAIYERFLEAATATVEKFKVGDPLDPDTYIGPLARAPQIEVLEAQIAEAQSNHAKVLFGGIRVEGPGNFFAPTIVANCDQSLKIMREESFGPIIGIQRVQDDREALALMNDTDYGLTAGVFTRDGERAEQILSQVNSGSVYWNCCDRVAPGLPWSGRKNSGLGLTLSQHGIETFTQTKAWHLKP